MHVDVIPCINEAKSNDFHHKTVIVVDVLRATSTIVTALAQGCSGIVPIETVCQAKSMKTADDLLGGERYCKKIPGFDLGNSPAEYLQTPLSNKRIVMTTTNGIRAIQKSQKASSIIAGAIVNAAACAKAALELNRNIVIVCAGTLNQFSLEDGLGAGFIIEELMQQHHEPISLNDFGTAMHSAYMYSRYNLEDVILSCENGRKLVHMGLKHDVEICSDKNRFSTVPILKDHVMVPYEVLKI